MKNKIKTYVDHYFRFDKRADLEQLKAEIVGNLYDRYDEAIENGLTEADAYIKTVKSMGDFQAASYNQTDISDLVLPSLPEYLLPASAILAAFGVILIFLNTVVGGVLTAVSIILYAVGGKYLYARAMYAKSHDLDIELHKNYLTKIFKYMKTSFAFWSISIAYLIAYIPTMLSQLFVYIVSLGIEPNYETIAPFVQALFIISLLTFILSFIILIIISYNVYQKLKLKYYILTGETELPGKIKDSFDYIQSADMPKAKNINQILSYILGLGSLGIFLLTHASFERNISGTMVDGYASIQLTSIFRLLQYEFFAGLCLLTGFVWVILTYILVLKYKKSTHLLYQSYIVLLILFSVHATLLNQANIYWDYGFSPIFIVIPALLSIIYYLVYGIQYGYQFLSSKKR